MVEVNEIASSDDAQTFEFLKLATACMVAFGVISIVWSLIAFTGPAADTLPKYSVEIDLSDIPKGKTVLINWHGTPVMIRHRTKSEIAVARAVNLVDLRDPQTDAERVIKPEWLVLVARCPGFGRMFPQESTSYERKGELEGWFCSRLATHYDMSGRILSGAHSENLTVPRYEFSDDNKIRFRNYAKPPLPL